MPTPLKDPALRRRRNHATTAATLPSEEVSRRRRVPPLPKDREWHPLTRAWWRDAWKSPPAAEWLEIDLHSLLILAVLLDRFWNLPNISLAAEIRQQEARFGLTPVDRRRLEWQVERTEATERRVAAPKPLAPIDDPRAALSVLK